jgi:hypothetical protein
MPDPVEKEGTENSAPTGNPNAGETAPAMQSITAELEQMVSFAGNYANQANFMNEVVQPLSLLLKMLLAAQSIRFAQVMLRSSQLDVLLIRLAAKFLIVSNKLEQAKAAMSSASTDPAHYRFRNAQGNFNGTDDDMA